MGGDSDRKVIDWPPHPSHPTQSARSHILNVFVEPEHRGRSLARAPMDFAVEEARRRGLDHMALHASHMGRPFQNTLGWSQTSEMGVRQGSGCWASGHPDRAS